jgi:hypothetical protein
MIAFATTFVLRVLDRDWQIALALALVLLAVRIALIGRDVVRGKLPRTRLLLPGIVWIETAGLAGDLMIEVRYATAGLLEVAFIVIAIRALRRPSDGPIEEHIARGLEALVPRAVARLAAIELTIAALAMRFLVGGWRRPVPAGFSYHRDNGLRQMLPMLPLLGIGDVLLLELVVLPETIVEVRVVVHFVAVWGLVWLVGLYASARERPHRIAGERVELYRGALRHLTIMRGDIASIAKLPTFGDGWKERSYKRASVRLDLGAAHVLVLTLHDGRRLLVGVDEPAAFEAALQREPDLVTGAEVVDPGARHVRSELERTPRLLVDHDRTGDRIR